MKTGYVLESPTWRASRDWGQKTGYSPKDLKEINRLAIAMLEDIRTHWEEEKTPTELDAGNPYALGQNYADLKACLPQLNIFGGCCGTDHRHVAAISGAVSLPSLECRLAA